MISKVTARNDPFARRLISRGGGALEVARDFVEPEHKEIE
jgi:hypothetical protein